MKRALIFDSGVGGLSVLDAIADAALALELDYVADNLWLPYGLKSDAALRERVPALLQAIASQWTPDVVVVACNTASTIALDAVRASLDVPVVGVVPPIKPAAALSKTGVIGLLATPATVQRAYTDDLIARFAADKIVLRSGSSALVTAAESKLAGAAVDRTAIAEAIDDLFGVPQGDRIDVVALACTHFPLLKQELAEAAPRPVAWLDSGAAIARRTADVAGAGVGASHALRAGFTDANAAAALAPAFARRGFRAFHAIGAPPAFSARRLVDYC
ncbi:MAG: glutamate racemase [Hyphomonadaceae bacterium]|nr:glutamate racemase [Hyphomonadaceae bacterium]